MTWFLCVVALLWGPTVNPSFRISSLFPRGVVVWPPRSGPSVTGPPLTRNAFSAFKVDFPRSPGLTLWSYDLGDLLWCLSHKLPLVFPGFVHECRVTGNFGTDLVVEDIPLLLPPLPALLTYPNQRCQEPLIFLAPGTLFMFIFI